MILLADIIQLSMGKIFTNCDMGECLTPNPDTKIMPLIDMASIACGGHAGDDTSMIETILLAKKNNTIIGAHPSYADKDNFGRFSLDMSKQALYDLLSAQLQHFQNLCKKNNTTLSYIKPHGALYHDMMKKPKVMQVIIDVVNEINHDLNLVVQAGDDKYLKNFGKNANDHFLHEVFADRAYDGLQMLPRDKKGSVFNDENLIIEQFEHFLNEKSFKIDTICFHSDNPASVKALEMLKNA